MSESNERIVRRGFICSAEDGSIPSVRPNEASKICGLKSTRLRSIRRLPIFDHKSFSRRVYYALRPLFPVAFPAYCSESPEDGRGSRSRMALDTTVDV